MPKAVLFEIPTGKPERAAEFCRTVFDWKIEKWQGPIPYWIIVAGDEKARGLMVPFINAASLRPWSIL